MQRAHTIAKANALCCHVKERDPPVYPDPLQNWMVSSFQNHGNQFWNLCKNLQTNRETSAKCYFFSTPLPVSSHSAFLLCYKTLLRKKWHFIGANQPLHWHHWSLYSFTCSPGNDTRSWWLNYFRVCVCVCALQVGCVPEIPIESRNPCRTANTYLP